MRRSRPRLQAMVAALFAADLAVLAGALGVAYLMRFRFEIGALETVPVAPFSEYLKPLAVLLCVVPLLLRLFDLYRTEGLRSGVEELHAISRAVTAGTVLVLALTFFYRREGFQYSRLTFLYWWALAIAGVTMAHAVFRRALLARYRAGLDRRRAVVVGEPSGYLLEKLRTEPAFGVEVAGYLANPAPDDEEEAAAGPGAESGRAGVLVRSAVASERVSLAALPRLGERADLAAVLERGDVDEAIIVEHGLSHRALLEAIDA
ncbi:MAG TPA: hypothetical protein VHF22_08905, partial [Planctomycetota bacterium]|nr:hypothetical protein [Planctomycetota bacterium]